MGWAMRSALRTGGGASLEMVRRVDIHVRIGHVVRCDIAVTGGGRVGSAVDAWDCRWRGHGCLALDCCVQLVHCNSCVPFHGTI